MRRVEIGLRFPDPRILFKRAGERFLQRRGDALTERRRQRCSVHQVQPGQCAERCRRVHQILIGLGQPRTGGLLAFFGLLLIRDADRALGHTFGQVAHQL